MPEIARISRCSPTEVWEQRLIPTRGASVALQAFPTRGASVALQAFPTRGASVALQAFPTRGASVALQAFPTRGASVALQAFPTRGASVALQAFPTRGASVALQAFPEVFEWQYLTFWTLEQMNTSFTDTITSDYIIDEDALQLFLRTIQENAYRPASQRVEVMPVWSINKI